MTLDSAGGAEQLKSALQVAAADARERQLRAEELLLVFKAIEQRLSTTFRPADTDRNRVIRALIEAYYASEKP